MQQVSRQLLPDGWHLETNPDPKSVRVWILLDPDGHATKWKTDTAATYFAQDHYLEPGRAKLRTLIKMLRRKYPLHHFEKYSRLSASTYFTIIRNGHAGNPFVIRLSDHRVSTGLERFNINIVDGKVDKCEVRRQIRKWWSAVA